MTIERVVSPGGIEAWLVQDRTLPLIAVEFAILGSADQDPADKPGVAQYGDQPARRRCRPLRCHGLPRPARAQGDRAQLSRRPRLFPRHLAHAHGEPRRSLRLSAAGVDRAALRCRCGRAHPRADHVAAAARDHEPERHREPQLVGDGVPRPSLRPAGQRHARIGSAHHRRRHEGLSPPGAGAEHDQAVDRRRHRRRDRGPAHRPHLRRAAGQVRAHAGSRHRAARTRPPHRHPARRAAGGGEFRRPRNRPQRSRLHGGLYRQSHPRRRLVHLAALSRGAREARPRLWRLTTTWSGSTTPRC